MANTTLPEKTYRITVRTDRPLLGAEGGGARYLWLRLCAPAPLQNAERPPLNLGLVLDHSGSMSGSKLDYAKRAASYALRLLNERDRAAVVIYDDEVQVLATSEPVTPGTRERLLRQVAAVQTGGSTNLGGGWLTGCEQVAAHLADGVVSRALLLTDGLANVGITNQEELATHAKALRQRGISTTTLGVGEDFDEFLLQAMADAGGGHFYFVANPEQIPDFFKGELGEMLEVVAREILLILPLPAGWRVDVLNDLEHEVVGGELRLGLGEAYRDEVRDVLLRLDLPAAPLAGTYELTPRLSHRAVGGPQQVQVVGETVNYAVGSPEQVARQAVDQEVLGLAARLEAERAKIKALRLERDGLREEARVALQEANVLVLGIAGPAQAAPMQSELDRLGEEVTIGLSAQERKAEHYTVYRMQRSRKDYGKGR